MVNEPLVTFTGATCAHGPRVHWRGLDLQVQDGQFIAVLGPNGAGKTSLLQVLLGNLPLAEGSATVAPGVRLGYVPQHRDFPQYAPIRGVDLVGFGLDGYRLGLPFGAGAFGKRAFGKSAFRAGAARQKLIDAAIAEVGATAYARAPISLLSGGELQRLRIAQALVAGPQVLLCDEPLVSLDIRHQRGVCDILAQRKAAGTAIIFVSHEINPIVELIDQVVYIARGAVAVGSAQEVMRSEVLSDLYEDNIKVIREDGRFFVLGGEDGTHHGAHGYRASSACCEDETEQGGATVDANISEPGGVSR